VVAEGAQRARAVAGLRCPLSSGPYSVTGSADSVPSGAISAPSGSFLPPLEATRTFPSATIDVAKSSSSMGAPASPGMPMHTGLVPNRRSTPPNGATISPFATLTK